MKKKSVYLFIFLWSTISFSQTVPASYQELYDVLFTKLITIDSSLTGRWNGDKFCTLYCTSLMVASSGRGEALLKPNVIEAVKLWLDALDSLGVRAVDIAIQYPILVDSFPKSAEYLDFYKKVVQEIRNREFKLIIGCQSTFRDSVFGGLDVESFYVGLNKERFKAEKKQMIETIISRLRPDYLTIETEPKTQGINLGLDYSVASVIEYVEYFLDGLDKKGVLIGGGSGTWDEIGYINAMAQQPEIDYIDFHIYPINLNYFVDQVFEIDSIASHYNKKLVLGECWLHKVTQSELGTMEPNERFARDIFSFWMPLDSMFIESVFKLSHLSKIELTSLIWATYFFAYVDYTSEYETMGLNQLYNLAYTAATPNILSKTFSPIGQLFYDRLKDACDSSITITWDEVKSPVDFLLKQNFPNPFNFETKICFEIKIKSQSCVKIYNLKGQCIQTILDQYLPAGKHTVSWDGRDDGGYPVPSGIYLFTIRVGKDIKSIKLMLIR